MVCVCARLCVCVCVWGAWMCWCSTSKIVLLCLLVQHAFHQHMYFDRMYDLKYGIQSMHKHCSYHLV